MSLPKYPEYRDSGVKWLGEVPAHWDTRSLKHIVSTPITDGPHETPDFKDEGIPFVSAEAVSSGIIDFGKIRGFISRAEHQRFSLKYRPRLHDIYMVKSGATTGITAIVESDLDFNIWSPLAAIRCDLSMANPYYILNFLRSRNFQEAVTQNWSFGTQQNIGMGVLGNLPVALPPLAEQIAIVTFLDHEICKIDALIAEQEKLTTLLAEKRQATMAHAVTRGLNPDAPLKDSGVNWLGDVPSHWRTGKIQSFARRESGHTPSRQRPEYWENCTVPWFSLADVWQIRDGKLNYVYETKEKVSELGLANSSARLLPAGTVMLSRTASVGYSAIMGCDMATTQDFINWVCGPLLNPEFLLYVLRGMRSEFDRLMMGSTHQTIYMPDIAKLAMALPPRGEQDAIVAFLNKTVAKFAALISDAECAITLLKERRQTLIAAAVTGQIDVRCTQRPAEKAEAMAA